MTKGKLYVYIFLVISVLFWAVITDAWGYSEHFLTSLPNDWNRYIYGYISRMVWSMPFLVLVVKETRKNAIPPKQVFGFHFHRKSFLAALALSTGFVLCGMYLTHGGWWTNPNIIFSQELSKFLIVGFVEELVYRGFGLTMLSQYMSGRKATVISALFFAALHIPAYFIHWYCDGIFLLTTMLTQLISAFLMGLMFGILFRKSKSVWASALVHFWYDFVFIVFIG